MLLLLLLLLLEPLPEDDDEEPTFHQSRPENPGVMPCSKPVEILSS